MNSNEPVAWRTHYPSGWEYKDGNPPFELKGNSQLLYTHPAKTLTELSGVEIIGMSGKYDFNYEVDIIDFARAILRKAQEK
jgi:hypothetical protein